MLLSFRFANHRSFRDEQQLNLTPVYSGDGDSSSPDQAVPVAGIFGANASGKSNALGALTFMRHLAGESDREVEPGLGLARDPFRLAPDHAVEPSRYVVDLLLQGVRHTYGFTIDDDRVLEEWLYSYPMKKKRRVFERDGDSFSWGEESGKRGELERIAEITASTALFLSTSARFSHSAHIPPREVAADPLSDVYLWFRRLEARTRSAGRPNPEKLTRNWPDDEGDRRAIVDLLRVADLGLADVAVRDNLRQEVSVLFPRRGGRLGNSKQVLTFTHKGADGDVLFDFWDESTGTQQLLDLAMAAVEALRTGVLMTIDEIDASLHPMLTARLIGLFQSPATNPEGGQLIFTSHDATLLGMFDTEEVLRRDQIWFTEKDDEGASMLYPLTDFKPRRSGENRPRRYLNGNYGGVPDLSADLFEQALVRRGELDDQATS